MCLSCFCISSDVTIANMYIVTSMLEQYIVQPYVVQLLWLIIVRDKLPFSRQLKADVSLSGRPQPTDFLLTEGN